MTASVGDPGVGTAPRILVCGWSGAGNVGDELLLSAVVDCLRSAGAVPVVASREPGTTSVRHGVESVAWGPRGWYMLFGRSGSKGDTSGRGASIDGVCVGPGGIIQDRSSVWSLPGHLLAPLWLRRRGKPVVGVGLGAEALRRRSSRRLLRSVLQGASVVVRDPASASAMAAAGVESSVGADLVFGLDLDPLRRRPEIVVAVGPDAAPGRLRPAGRRLAAEDPSLVAAALDALAQRVGASISLACFRGERDRAYAQLLTSRIRHDTEILGPDIDAQVDRIRSARVLVSSRYHPVVIAARSGTPAIVCSNETKLDSLVVQLESPQVTRIDGWSALSACELAEPGEPVVPQGVGLHHDALRRLVADSSAR